jgi:hypothetical protein
MDTTALAVVEPQEAVSLLESPLSPAETAELQSCELAIELAGKDRLEKALIIGEKLSTIYNHALFRGADGGCTWEQWLKERLPQLLPEADGRSTDWGDRRRLLWEERKLLSSCARAPGVLPETTRTVDALTALVPRRFSGPSGWNPAVLDDPNAAQGISKVWELACLNAERNQRRNGPTAEDVRAAREELRPALEQQGLIRSAPTQFQAATAARVEAARQRTITVNPEEEERKAAAFRETMASIRASAPERQAKVAANEVRDEADKAEREHQQLLEQEVRSYNSKLQGASGAIHDLLTYLQNLSRVHGTQLLDEMRCTDVLGLISVRDDIQRLQEAGQDLIAAVKLAQSSDPPSGIDMSTFTVVPD